jgi:hypothetical protein
MTFFFENHPRISYDVQKNGISHTVQNPLVRFKIQELLKSRSALYYTHDIEEGQSIEFIADRYYGDSTLDWVIYIVNDIIDPQYDLPMDYQQFVAYVKSKYGSVESALNTVHHYEHIIQIQSVLFDGTIVPEKVIVVDETTYNTLVSTERREVSNYTYEERLNESKRTIKVLHTDYLGQFLDEAERIFE